jgi:DnaJ homolog subfamily C member 2
MQLPSISANWDISKDCIFHKKLAKVINKPVEAAGHAFMSRVRRSLNKRSLAEDYELTKSLNDAAGADDDEEIDEPETKKLLSLNPANWKKQDHYAVLGLSKKRYLATDDEIKKAYRKKVLKHHPDKKAHLGGNDNFFKCIQKGII